MFNFSGYGRLWFGVRKSCIRGTVFKLRGTYLKLCSGYMYEVSGYRFSKLGTDLHHSGYRSLPFGVQIRGTEMAPRFLKVGIFGVLRGTACSTGQKKS